MALDDWKKLKHLADTLARHCADGTRSARKGWDFPTGSEEKQAELIQSRAAAIRQMAESMRERYPKEEQLSFIIAAANDIDTELCKDR
jgi:hypothetical protein